ncbi:MAG: T9SS type A sorting domain-containing protein [Chitinophagales bacterium]|nr:T9SS type A sorting domain-containing protein [Chitinophagales bacterium]
MLIGEGLTIQGNVYHDGNGMTDDYVNGAGVNVGGQIYAILTDTNGVVLQSVPVNSDGTYEFTNAPFQTDLLVVIDTVQREKGTTVTSSTLPDGWVSTGEKLGKIDAVSGNDGNIDGKNSEVGKPRTNLVDINFGIQQPPLADPKEYYLETTDFSLTPVSGYPAVTTPTGDDYYSIPTSSPSLTGVTNYVNKGLLTGSDPEDCVVCKDNATYIINEIYPTTRLYYDFGGNRGVDEVVPGDTLVNYDPNKLVIYGMKGAGQVDSLTDKPLGFQYSLVDNAGFSSPAVDYRITTDAALPIELIYFTATSEDCKVLTQWATASELNNDYFEVQRSYNAKGWETIATMSGNGTTNLRHDYTYVDQEVQSGLVYYRLKQTDFDGTVATHKIVSVNVIGCDETSIRLYPNPTSSLLRVEIKGKDLLKTQFNVISTDGRLMMSIDKVETSNTIDVSRFAAGTYYLQITDRSNGQIQSLPFVIVK